MAAGLFTIGHSTHSIERFIALLNVFLARNWPIRRIG